MRVSTVEIEAWVRAHQKGDRHAFTQILEAYKHELWSYLVNHVYRYQDAEDLYQEICLKLFSKLDTLKEPAKFKSWYFSVAMNAVRSFYRRQKGRPFEVPTGQDAAEKRGLIRSDQPKQDRSMIDKERLSRLRRCIKKLPERDREVLLLDTMAELPQQEIADKMDLNLNTVKTIVRRTKIKLARMMVEVDDGR